MHPMISLWFLKFSGTMGDQYFGVFCFRGAVFLPSPMASCLEMCGHRTLSPRPKWVDFSFQKPKASTHPALNPGLVEPCFYSGAFFFLLFLTFFFHLKFFFFTFSFCLFLFSHLIFLCFFFFFSVLVFCCGGGCFSCLVLFLLLTFLVLFPPSPPPHFPNSQNVSEDATESWGLVQEREWRAGADRDTARMGESRGHLGRKEPCIMDLRFGGAVRQGR